MMPYRVVLCLRGGVGGVDVFSSNLVEELLRRGVEAKILLTKRARSFLPQSLPIDELPMRREQGWPARWHAAIRYLESQAPCIFIPNYEDNYSCISPMLSRKVIVIGILHSDQAIYYENLLRLGMYWNGLVTVSRAIADHLAGIDHPLQKKTVTIPYGVTVPPVFPESHRPSSAPLRIVYVGRLVQPQKRILDLPEIFHRLLTRNPNVEITIIGDGSDRSQLLDRCEHFITGGQLRYLGVLSNRDVLENLERQDVVLLTSDFEGMPIAILEAMGRGCVPVVTNIRSGIPELVQDGHNGFVVEIGDTEAFANRLLLLQQDLSLRKRMSHKAYQTVRENFEVKRMTEQYMHFFERLIQEVEQGLYHRPKGAIVMPPELDLSWKQYLPAPARSALLHGRRLIRRVRKLASGGSQNRRTPR